MPFAVNFLESKKKSADPSSKRRLRALHDLQLAVGFVNESQPAGYETANEIKSRKELHLKTLDLESSFSDLDKSDLSREMNRIENELFDIINAQTENLKIDE